MRHYGAGANPPRFTQSSCLNLAHHEVQEAAAVAGCGWLDVTDALQFLVTDDATLDLAEGSSCAGLLGFGDPCPEERKRLVVQYMFRGQRFILATRDGEPLSLPRDRTGM